VTATHLVKEPFGPLDLYVVRNMFAPGGQTGWHTHLGPSFVIVTEGQITAYDGDDPTCTPKVYRAGQGFLDIGAGRVHLLRNETGAPQ
jgi:quercetin dioxygenase-like cupin family protein